MIVEQAGSIAGVSDHDVGTREPLAEKIVAPFTAVGVVHSAIHDEETRTHFSGGWTFALGTMRSQLAARRIQNLIEYNCLRPEARWA